MLLEDKKLSVCGNLEEVANDYQASTSAVRVLELRDVCTQLSGWHLGRYGGVACNRRYGGISSKQVIQKHTPVCTVEFGACMCLNDKQVCGTLRFSIIMRRA